jgi:hypothetical protein
MKTFKICKNGFIKFFDGKEVHLFFYNPKIEHDLIAEGVKQVY